MSVTIGAADAANYLKYSTTGTARSLPWASLVWFKQTGDFGATGVMFCHSGGSTPYDDHATVFTTTTTARPSFINRWTTTGDGANVGTAGELLQNVWYPSIMVAEGQLDRRWYWGFDASTNVSLRTSIDVGAVGNLQDYVIGQRYRNAPQSGTESQNVRIARVAVWYGFPSESFNTAAVQALMDGALPTDVLPTYLYAYWPLTYTGGGNADYTNHAETGTKTMVENGTFGEADDEPPIIPRPTATGPVLKALLGR